MNRFQILLDKPIAECPNPEDTFRNLIRSLLNLPESIVLELKRIPLSHVKIPGENQISYTPNFTKNAYVYRDGIIKLSGVADFYPLKKQTLYNMREALKLHTIPFTKIILLLLDEEEEKMVGLWIPHE